jgi:hypothetical protein
MTSIMFRCPTTRQYVQHWIEDDPNAASDAFLLVKCPACGKTRAARSVQFDCQRPAISLVTGKYWHDHFGRGRRCGFLRCCSNITQSS